MKESAWIPDFVADGELVWFSNNTIEAFRNIDKPERNTRIKRFESVQCMECNLSILRCDKNERAK